MQFHNIHCSHCQSSAIDHTTDAAVERYVVQFPMCRMRLALIFLRRVVHLLQCGLSIQCIGIHDDLGIQTMQVTLVGNHQGIHLNQRQILLLKQFSQTQKDSDKLLNLNP